MNACRKRCRRHASAGPWAHRPSAFLIQCTRQRCQVDTHHAPDRSLEALVRVGDHQLGAAQPALDQAASGTWPRRSRPPRGRCAAPRFPACPPCWPPRRLWPRPRLMLSALALLEVGGIQPEIRPVALKRAVEEGVHPVVDVLAQLADRALADAGSEPIACTRSSTRRVETPLIQASCMTATRAFSDVFLGFQEGREVAALAAASGCGAAGCRAACPASGRGSRCGRWTAPAVRSCRPAPIRPVHVRFHQQLHNRLRHTAQEVAISGFGHQLGQG